MHVARPIPGQLSSSIEQRRIRSQRRTRNAADSKALAISRNIISTYSNALIVRSAAASRQGRGR
jgi:hypothetical protein